jgi:hypothetical protein
MSSEKGSSDESIGRPAEWREGRYQQPGKPVDECVRIPVDERNRSREPISTPVTRRDYEQRKSSSPVDCSLSQWNVGTGTSYAMR